nr:unnamed protein product [Haemonchus contortus]
MLSAYFKFNAEHEAAFGAGNASQEPEHLWEQFKSAMAEDYVRRGLSDEEGIIRAYYDLMDRMQICGVNLSSFVTPPSD